MFTRCHGYREFLLAPLLAAILACPPLVAGESSEQATVPTSLERVLAGDAPQSVAELKVMETRVRELSAHVISCTVSVGVGSRHGSGVIVSPEGLVLTAAHVIEEANRNSVITLPDGHRVLAKTLGLNRTIDAGMVKIVDRNRHHKNGDWPYREMGDSTKLEPGQWCLATGHPNGFQTTRGPVVRLGRVLSINESHGITTDCTLVGGDSGGPLFDMDGRVIGIHSRIGGSLALNIHIPTSDFQESWERMVKGEEWGSFPGTEPFIGVQGDKKARDARIAEVFPHTPAAKAGIRAGDVLTKFNGQPIPTFDSLIEAVATKKPGDKVALELRRNDQSLQLELIVGKRDN